jgi:hypothetical protein
MKPNCLAGASVRAVTAALISGSIDPVDALRQFWAEGNLWSSPVNCHTLSLMPKNG